MASSYGSGVPTRQILPNRCSHAYDRGMRVRAGVALPSLACLLGLAAAAHVPALASGGCTDPASAGPTGGSVSIESPWTLRDDPQVSVFTDDGAVDQTTITVTIT